MFDLETITAIVTGTIGTVGFAILFNSEIRRLPFATLGGFISCVLYFFFISLTKSEFAANFIAAFVATTYFEICAKRLKAPVVVFLIPGLIPLVPGRALYYTMSGAIAKNFDEFSKNGLTTLLVAGGIAGGIIFSSLIFYVIKNYIEFRKTK